MSRASGRTSANVGRSPKPSKWAASGTRARRIASRPLRPTVTTARSPAWLGDLLGREPDRVRVERPGEAAVARHEDDEPLAALAPGEQRVLVAAEDDGEVGEDLVELLAVRPGMERRVLGALQLRRGDELHRPRDLLDVADRGYSPPDLALAGHLGEEALAELAERLVELRLSARR